MIRKKGESVTAEEIIAHVRAQLAGYKVPRDIVFPHDLPRTPTGKILKFELRASNNAQA